MRRRGYTPPGTYVALKRAGKTIMSDTFDELEDHFTFVAEATGKVLISGLGLGLVAIAVAVKPNVESVTVVERDPDVIALTAPYLPKGKIEIVHADVNEWTPPKGANWDRAWHDIWDEITPRSLPEMRRIRDRFRRNVDAQSFWSGPEVYFHTGRRNRFLIAGAAPRDIRRAES